MRYQSPLSISSFQPYKKRRGGREEKSIGGAGRHNAEHRNGRAQASRIDASRRQTLYNPSEPAGHRVEGLRMGPLGCR